MDYKVFSKQLLKSKRKMEAARANLADEIFMLEEAKSSIGVCGGRVSPTCGGGSRFEDRLVKLICICDDLALKKRNIEMNLKCIERGLAAVSEEDRRLLEIFYISGERYAAEIAMQELCKERSTVYRELDRALANFTSALYGDKMCASF